MRAGGVRLFVFVARCLTAAALAVLSFQSGGILRNTRRPGGFIGLRQRGQWFVPTDSLVAARPRLRNIGAPAMKKLNHLCVIAIGSLASTGNWYTSSLMRPNEACQISPNLDEPSSKKRR